MQLVVLNLAVNSMSSESAIVVGPPPPFFALHALGGVFLSGLAIRCIFLCFLRSKNSAYLRWQMVRVCLFVCLLSAFSAKCLALVSNASGDSPVCEEGCGERHLLPHCFSQCRQLGNSAVSHSTGTQLDATFCVLWFCNDVYILTVHCNMGGFYH